MTVGHQAILHGCTVEDEALIGMGARILNGAAIGSQCIVGAGALVTEGKVFQPRSLIVGSPARAVRQLSEQSCAAQNLGGSLCRKGYPLRRPAQGTSLTLERPSNAGPSSQP